MPPEGGSEKSFQPCAPHEGGSKETSLSGGYSPEKIRKSFQMPPEGGSGKSFQPATPEGGSKETFQLTAPLNENQKNLSS